MIEAVIVTKTANNPQPSAKTSSSQARVPSKIFSDISQIIHKKKEKKVIGRTNTMQNNMNSAGNLKPPMNPGGSA
tara:strand:- start:515 stop:739 length:225 start_codon:yes stop_codon:yes gene_type:complete